MRVINTKITLNDSVFASLDINSNSQTSCAVCITFTCLAASIRRWRSVTAEKTKRIFPFTATNKIQEITYLYNITKRSVRVTNVVVETKKYHTLWGYVCGLIYPACNANALYCHTWPPWLYRIFSHYLINGILPEKHYGKYNVFFYFLYNLYLKQL
jgi:hypothetical protein